MARKYRRYGRRWVGKGQTGADLRPTAAAGPDSHRIPAQVPKPGHDLSPRGRQELDRIINRNDSSGGPDAFTDPMGRFGEGREGIR